MNVLFISDFGLEHNTGGAQRSNYIIATYGQKRGHFVHLHNFDSSPLDWLYDWDLVISSNLEVILKKRPDALAFILKQKRHIRLEHDMSSYMHPEVRRALFGQSLQNIFLSDFHIRCFKDTYGDHFPNTSVVYDPIDSSQFYNKGKEREPNSILYCGFLHPLKGSNSLIQYARRRKDCDFHVYGWGEQKIKDVLAALPNITVHDPVSYDEVPDLYNKYQYIFHKPVVNEPFCRMVAEAAICGMEVIANDKIGAVHEIQKIGVDKFTESCDNAHILFWDIVESCIK